MAYTATSEIDAINHMLTAVGEAPVSSLVDPKRDVAIAKQVLDQIAVEFLALGWSFNTNEAEVLVPDVNGEIVVPATVIRVDPVRNSVAHPVLRLDVGKLYDAYAGTYVFSGSVTAQVTHLTDWEGLPQPARSYVAARAARAFNDRVYQDGELRQTLIRDELLAEGRWLTYESEQEDHTMLESPLAFATINRQPILNF